MQARGQRSLICSSDVISPVRKIKEQQRRTFVLLIFALFFLCFNQVSLLLTETCWSVMRRERLHLGAIHTKIYITSSRAVEGTRNQISASWT